MSDDAIPALNEVKAYVREQVAPGFRGLDAVLEATHDSFGELPTADVDRAIGEVWAERLTAERTWADEGDYEKLERAFGALAQDGYVARMNFTCCQTCGHTEIADERTGGEVAYVFFHQQDSEGLIGETPAVYLSYGIFDAYPGLEDLREAARGGDEGVRESFGTLVQDLEVRAVERVIERLREQGLEVAWEGRGSRPLVSLPEWRKKLPA